MRQQRLLWYELVTNNMDKAVNFCTKVVGWDVRDAGMPGFTCILFGKDGQDVRGMMTWAGASAPELPPEWMGHIHNAELALMQPRCLLNDSH